MKKTLVVANPETSRVTPGDGMSVLAGHTSYGNKPVILEVGNPATRGDPNSPAVVLKEGLHILIRQTTPLVVNRNLPVVPPVQAMNRAKPNAAIARRQNRPSPAIRQALL